MLRRRRRKGRVGGRGAARTGAFVDSAHVKKQPDAMTRLLDQVGLAAKLRGQGPQRRCACPIHRGDGRGRTFSVNLEENVFQCFEASCGAKGDVIDPGASAA
ncbi:MAG: CHC2 zinc finger domain-containing protein [Gemmataceae bacterium]